VTLDLSRPRHIHLVGVGGAGMSAIARVLLQRGHRVTGTDLHDSRTLTSLSAMGAELRVGHDAEALGDAEAVVVSTAVPPTNPEVVAATERSIPVLQRAEMLAALMDDHRALLVSGTHGKTTTTSMVVVALQSAGLDPSFAVGGALNEAGSNAHAGDGDVFVAEADESDRSFLAHRPDAIVVTNVELDHPDQFHSLTDVLDAFTAFAERRTNGAPAIVCRDDPGARTLADRIAPPVVGYGEDPRAEVRLVIEGGRAWVRIGDDAVPLELSVPGRHNQLNATAALAACHWAGADLEVAARGLAVFRGAQRRFQDLGTAQGVRVVDDYAHHPTELRATLATARAVTEGRVVLVVEPHRYTRTEVFGAELGRAAAGADLVIVTDVYASNEDPIPGVTGRLVADAARDAGAKVVWEPHLAAVGERLRALVQPGDLVLTTGAGDVTTVGPELLDRLGGAT
jgi:UDP-N-acetylmuramate--alanine ligase